MSLYFSLSLPLMDIPLNRRTMVVLFLKDMFYGYSPVKNALFIMDILCSNLIFDTHAKRLKMAEKTNTKFLWHCRLAHIKRNT